MDAAGPGGNRAGGCDSTPIGVADSPPGGDEALKSILEHLPLAAAMLDADLRYVAVSNRWREDYGLGDQALVGRHHYDVFPEIRGRPDWQAIHQRALAGAIERRQEDRFVRADGSEAWQRWEVRPWREASGRIRGILIFTEDISARKRSEAELRRARDELEQRVRERTAELRQRGDQLARLASELVLVEQRERQRLARKLHDELQQLLASAKYELDAALPRVAASARPAVQRASDVIEQAIRSSRLLTVELSPTILHEAGLAAGLRWLARWMKDKHGLDVELHIADEELGEREDVRLLIFESIREALFNVVKHAQVRRACVKVSREDGDRLRVEVSDAGRGFDVGAPMRSTDSLAGGFGLFSIRERLTLLGGGLRVDSAPGRGTRITMEAPLKPAAFSADAQAQPAADGQRGVSDGVRRMRVLLVDDHRVVRHGLSALLSARVDIEVVGEASSGEEAITLAGSLQPDVILMDYSMPGMNGVTATQRIHARWPSIRVVGLSMYDEPTITAAMRAAGASACVAKGGDTETLLAAVRAAG